MVYEVHTMITIKYKTYLPSERFLPEAEYKTLPDHNAKKCSRCQAAGIGKKI